MKYGPTHNDIQTLAYQLYVADKVDGPRPKGNELEKEIREELSDKYWPLAYRQLVPEVQLAIDAELPEDISLVPTNDNEWPISIRITDGLPKQQDGSAWNASLHRQFADARIHNNAKVELRVYADPDSGWLSENAVRGKYVSGKTRPIHEYDLNSDQQLEWLLEDIVRIGYKTQQHDQQITSGITIQRIYINPKCDGGEVELEDRNGQPYRTVCPYCKGDG